MQKKSVVNLIKTHVNNDRKGFLDQAYSIAKDFDASGDVQLSEYIMSLLSSANTLVPQEAGKGPEYMEKVDLTEPKEMLFLPEPITNDLLGIVNAVGHNVGINRFLFQGAPGTGKTVAAKYVTKLLKRDLYQVDFTSIIDSKLGQTQKNISGLFAEINSFAVPEKIVVLFDEIDALALDRTNEHDIREMGRATSELLKCMDRLDERVVIIGTTNLFRYFDKAFIRRFDAVIDFDRYSKDDLMDISGRMLEYYLTQMHIENRDTRLFRKIMNLSERKIYPGDLKNMIRSSVAFSNPGDLFDYFRRLYSAVTGTVPEDIQRLKQEKFTVREIEKLTGISKSSVSRDLIGGET